jgi:hypothetical protein
VKFKNLIIYLGLGILLSPTSYCQVLTLDTVIKTPLIANYSETGNFFIDNDSLFISIAYKVRDSIVLLKQNLQGDNFYKGGYTVEVPWLMYANFYNGSVLIGSPSNHGLLNYEIGEYRDLSKIKTLKDVVFTDYFAVSLETYPDYNNPSENISIVFGKDLFSMEEEISIPFDFPHYLAKPHHLFDVKDSILCYCNTTKYECSIFNLSSGKSEVIISEKLNQQDIVKRIELFREKVFKGSQQPKKWIPELTSFDDSISRITKVFYDGNAILIVKKPPQSHYDYRLLDKYELQYNKWVRVIKDYRVEKYPDTLSFTSPYCPLMYSSPVTFYGNKIYVLSSVDYINGLRNSISKDEFIKAKDKYYESHDNYYTVFVYSFR